MNADQRKQVAIDIAKLYYINGLSQDEIANSTGMSRSNISRIIRKCISDGIVEITVHDNISESPELANRIKTYYKLNDVIIVPSNQNEDKQARIIGDRLAQYLDSILKDNMTIGVGSGKACYYTARNLKNPFNYTVNVVQLVGVSSSVAQTGSATGNVSFFASKLNGKGYMLSAPLMVRSKSTKSDLLKNTILSNVVAQYSNIKIAIFEIMKPDLFSRNLSKQEWLSKADLLQLSEVKAASCVCGYYFNINGKSCNVGINDRLIAINQPELMNVETSIGILTGKDCLDAALSAIRSKMVRVLVVDEVLAQIIEETLPNKKCQQ